MAFYELKKWRENNGKPRSLASAFKNKLIPFLFLWSCRVVRLNLIDAGELGLEQMRKRELAENTVRAQIAKMSCSKCITENETGRKRKRKG